MIKRRPKALLVITIVILCLVMIAAGLYLVMNARDFQLFGKLVSHIQTDKKTVYLTFDDGPSDNTARILDKLDALGMKATFFLIGKSMEDNPELARQIIEAEHDIGNHSYSHTRLIFRSPTQTADEVDKTNDIIRGFGYSKEIFFRPPNGKKLILLPWHLSQIGQTTVMWTLEPDSFGDVNKDAESMAKYVIDNVSDGAIILLHPMNDKTDKTLNAVELIVNALREKGYTFETLSQGVSE